MRNRILLISSLLCFISIANAQIIFKNLTLEGAISEAKKENKLVFLDVYASWCRPCKMLDSNVFPDKKLGDFYNTNFICIKINGESPEGKIIMKDYNLTSYPSLVFLDADKKMVKLVKGYVEADVLLKQGNYAKDPSSMPSAKSLADYNKEPTRENFKKLIIDLRQDDVPFESYCIEYLKKYPELDLKENADLVVFFYANYDVNSVSFKNFINNSADFDSEVIIVKVESVLEHYLLKAVEEKNMKVVLDVLDVLFPAYGKALNGEFEKEDIVAILQKYYDEQVKL